MSPPGAGDGDDPTGDDPPDGAVPPRDDADESRPSSADGSRPSDADESHQSTTDGDSTGQGVDPVGPGREATSQSDPLEPTPPGDETRASEADGTATPEEAPAAPVERPTGEYEAGDGDTHSEWRSFAYDVVSSMVAVVLVGALLFAVSGVWPPMVAVESPSMTPNMKTGDLVFVMEAERFPGEGATGDTGVVTAHTGRTTDVDYSKFDRQGDVIVYAPGGNEGTTPIIHRAMFWVEDGENWYEEANKQAIGRYSECGDSPDEALPNCPAPHAGFITKGDANGIYDQAQGLSAPVRPSWVVGTAEVRVPWLGCIRLRTERCTNAALGADTGATLGAGPATGATPVAGTNATLADG
jgi:signal peptidase